MQKECWYCKKESTDLTVKILLKNSPMTTVDIPRCETCAQKHKRATKSFFITYFIGAIGILIYLLTQGVNNIEGGFQAGLQYGVIHSIVPLALLLIIAFVMMKLSLKGIPLSHYGKEHPDAKAKLSNTQTDETVTK